MDNGGAINLAESQAIVMLHEAIHLTGIRDEHFNPNRDVGSRILSTLIIRSCFDVRFSHGDMAFF